MLPISEVEIALIEAICSTTETTSAGCRNSSCVGVPAAELGGEPALVLQQVADILAIDSVSIRRRSAGMARTTSSFIGGNCP